MAFAMKNCNAFVICHLSFNLIKLTHLSPRIRLQENDLIPSRKPARWKDFPGISHPLSFDYYCKVRASTDLAPHPWHHPHPQMLTILQAGVTIMIPVPGKKALNPHQIEPQWSSHNLFRMSVCSSPPIWTRKRLLDVDSRNNKKKLLLKGHL